MLLEYILLIIATLLLLSIIASKVSSRLGVPALLLFLVIGMLAGSDGPGGIYFDDAQAAQTLGVIALTFILFAGGLETDLKEIRPVVKEGISLATLGVFLTGTLVALFLDLALGFTLQEGLLIGSIIASTDAAAVFSVLRPRSMDFKRNLKPLLELESGSNDPMAVLLTISMIRVITEPDTTIPQLVLMFVQQMVIGAVMGYVLGKAIGYIINRLKLEADGLYPVVTVAFVFFVYGVTTILGGNPFLAAYIAGIVLGNQTFIHRNSLIQFHDGLAWLMQIAMFLTLGLLVFPSQLPGIALTALAASAFLILVARPVSVFISLAFSKRPVRDKLAISWVGLRGAAPIILATFPLLAGVPNANTIFNIVFFVVLTSVLLQGTTIEKAARLLRVDKKQRTRPRYPIEFVPSENLRNELYEVTVPPDSFIAGKQILEIGLPPHSLIVLLARNNEFVVPRGSTTIQEGDRLLVLADSADREVITQLLHEQHA